MATKDDVLEVNRAYGSTFDEAELPARPARRLAVVACMDSRLDPAKSLRLEVGDALVIRNAGGVVSARGFVYDVGGGLLREVD